MTSDQQALWIRIKDYAIDDPHSSAPFSLRLARENQWGPSFTARVIEEYRRFIFLAVSAGHPVSPSDAVDQVWHLHLLYTRCYWDDFCGRVLGQPLHHGPSRGGSREHAKYTDWYAQTLATYRTFFGEPPSDIWPAQPAHPCALRVDRNRVWVVPKPALARLIRAAWMRVSGKMRARRGATTHPAAQAGARTAHLWLAGVLLLVPQRSEAAVSSMWPFTLSGPEFIPVFLVLALVAFLWAGWLRRSFRQPDTVAGVDLALDPYSAAFLAGGPSRVLLTAIASLLHRGLLETSGKHVRRTDRPMPGGLPLVERAVLDAITADGRPLAKIRSGAQEAIESIRQSLIERGMILSGGAARIARLVPAMVAALIPAIGIMKINIGLERHRPVVFLVILTIISAVIALIFLLRPARLSRRGDQALRKAREGRERIAKLDHGTLNTDSGGLVLPLAVGLFGLSALAQTPLHGQLERLGPYRDGSGHGGGGCGSSCGGGGGDGGGGGGCGGCGGGGGD